MTLAQATGASVNGAPTLGDVRGWPATIGVREAAAALGTSVSWAYELVKAGEFPVRTIVIRGRVRVVTASLLQLLEGA